MKRINSVLFAAALALLVAAGCVSTKSQPAESIRPVLPKLKEYSLKLEIPETRRHFSASSGDLLPFLLRNTGTKSIDLVEWQVDETKNMHYYYRPYEGEMVEFDRKDPRWKEYLPDQSGPLRYNAFAISPYNRVFIDLPMPFIKQPGVYMIVGELLLTAVDVQTEVTVIEITK